jgi:hypothetical protein
MLDKSIHADFLDLFYSDIKDQVLENDNKLNVFTLKVTNNSFAYNELIDLLGDKLHHFALSRKEIQYLMDQDKLRTLIDKSKSKLRQYIDQSQQAGQGEGGELGELLLYCLLECHLNAPKILTKLEIKTSNQMYVNGADGVHLLRVNDKDYQLVFGESKLNADLQQGIYKAFESIAKLLTDRKGKLEFEIDLVNSQLTKEACSDEAYAFIKRIIMPSAQEDTINMDYSFGIFLGYNLHLNDEDRKKPNAEFREALRSRIREEILGKIASINYQIKKQHFVGYNFYMYIIPFSDLEAKRVEIINELSK